MTDQALAIVPQKNSIINSYDDLSRAAGAMSKSGYFQDSKEQAQAIVKIMAGQEMGFGPFASMTGVYIIKGKPSIGANLMAAAVKGSGKYNYRVTEMTDKVCSIDFYEGKEMIGTSAFTIEDAKRAETQNIAKFPRNMLFARAMSNGAKWYCPDVFNGSPIYTPEELGAEVDSDGNVVNGSWKDADPEPVTTEVSQPEQEYLQTVDHTKATPVPVAKKPERPYSPEVLKKSIDIKVNKLGGMTASDKQIGLLASMLDKCFAGEEKSSDMRHAVQEYLTGYKSSKDMPGAYVKVLLDWLDAKQDSGGDYTPSALAIKEAQAIRTQSLLDAGQMTLLETAAQLGCTN